MENKFEILERACNLYCKRLPLTKKKEIIKYFYCKIFKLNPKKITKINFDPIPIRKGRKVFCEVSIEIDSLNKVEYLSLWDFSRNF